MHPPTGVWGRYRPTSHIYRPAFLVLGVALIAVGAFFSYTQAQAVLREIQDAETPGLLSLVIPSRELLWASIDPGDTHYWVVEASLADAPSSTLALELATTGDTTALSQYSAQIEACPTPYQGDTHPQKPPICAEHSRLILSTTPLTEVLNSRHHMLQLPDLTPTTPQHFLVTVHNGASPTSAAPASTPFTIGLGYHAAGGSAQHTTVAPLTQLATTATEVFPVALLGCGLICAALALRLGRKPAA